MACSRVNRNSHIKTGGLPRPLIATGRARFGEHDSLIWLNALSPLNNGERGRWWDRARPSLSSEQTCARRLPVPAGDGTDRREDRHNICLFSWVK